MPGLGRGHSQQSATLGKTSVCCPQPTLLEVCNSPSAPPRLLLPPSPEPHAAGSEADEPDPSLGLWDRPQSDIPMG